MLLQKALSKQLVFQMMNVKNTRPYYSSQKVPYEAFFLLQMGILLGREEVVAYCLEMGYCVEISENPQDRVLD